MGNRKKAPMWVMLKTAKRQVRALQETNEWQAQKLLTALATIETYKKGYELANDAINKRDERIDRLIEMLDGYVLANVELKRQIKTLTAQQ